MRFSALIIVIGCCASVAWAQAPPSTLPAELTDLDAAHIAALLNAPASGDRGMDFQRKARACGLVVSGLPDATKTVPALIALLDDPQLSRFAVPALGRIANVASDELTEATRSKSAAIRAGAACAMVTLGMQVEPTLKDLADHDPDEAVRRQATYALACIGSPDASAHILNLLHDPNYAVRAECIKAIENWPITRAVAEELGNLIASTDLPVRQAAVERLLKDTDNGQYVYPRIAWMPARQGQPGQKEALLVLAHYEPASQTTIDAALQCVQSGKVDILRAGSDVLGGMGRAGVPAIYPLAQILGARAMQRTSLADYPRSALGRILKAQVGADGKLDTHDPDRLIDSLASVMHDPKSDGLAKRECLKLLYLAGSRAKVILPDLLTMLVSSGDDEGRLLAAKILTNLAPAGEKADDAVVRALSQHPRPELGVELEAYLIACGDKASPSLLKLMKGEDSLARLSALRVMHHLSAEPALAGAILDSLPRATEPELPEALGLVEEWCAAPENEQTRARMAEYRQQVDRLASHENPEISRHALAIQRLITPPAPQASVVSARATRSWLVALPLLVMLILGLLVVGVWIIRSAARAAHPPIASASLPPPLPVVCPRCKKLISRDSKYCRRCGLTMA